MSGMMHKIADAITGHHHTNTNTNTNTSTAATNSGTTNSNSSSSAYNHDGMRDKSGAQVRDMSNNTVNNMSGVGMNSTSNSTSAPHSAAYDSYNQSNSALPSTATGAAAGLGAGSALGSASNSYSQLSSSSQSSLHSSAVGSNSSSSFPSSAAMASTSQRDLNATTAATATATADKAVTLHEEHLVVGKEKVAAGSVALNKYVTTETVGTAVPIIKERVVIEREPITEANRDLALQGETFKEASHSVTLMEERAVATKEVVPMEVIRLRKEQEKTNQYVEAELRKEHVELIDQTQTVGLADKQYQAGGLNSASGAGMGMAAGRQSEIDSTSAAARKL